jgi:hypothetical protein
MNEPRVILLNTLYAFGNRHQPRLPRPGKDIQVHEDRVQPTHPPTGASTFSDIQEAPLTGHYYRLAKGTTLPEELGIIADGKDVGGTHLPTHHTLYPNREMSFAEFVAAFLQCGWVYAGKKEPN